MRQHCAVGPDAAVIIPIISAADAGLHPNPMSKLSVPKALLPFRHSHSMLKALKSSYPRKYNQALGRAGL